MAEVRDARAAHDLIARRASAVAAIFYRLGESVPLPLVARELARINLPLSLYTEMYWQIDLNNLFHFLRLRMDWHAQYEIRVYGDAMAAIARAVCPLAHAAFEEHILHGRNFAKSEIEMLAQALDREALDAAIEASGKRATRRREFLAKLRPAGE